MSGEILRTLLHQRASDLGKTVKAIAADAGLARTYLYKLAAGTTVDPSVGTLARLAEALQISPIALLRHYMHLGVSDNSLLGKEPGASRSRGLTAPDDAIMLNADITIPDHSVVRGGEAFRKVWEIQNVGRTYWRGRRLIRADQQYILSTTEVDGALKPLARTHLSALNQVVPIPETPPGACVQLVVDFAAPRKNCSVASVWRIHDEVGTPCYDSSFILQVVVTVIDQ
ncbi:NBR1-Ig-like domain-containing protein [Paucibacter sp. XJ19-41]|uniref:NBR1-Ig-like domain-containing protein n=1 Tax=Paucibacter sp. XJ19-41 TaxID=2927824 RepID=UPI00234910CB|nr:NBR1-Ig-like domain-containing protein [Paucibacter sp. XJ19-41]MDC6169126.1 NBR1-Ig-like domain-containing protein [Paucibacter sp. XJ19-41]